MSYSDLAKFYNLITFLMRYNIELHLLHVKVMRPKKFFFKLFKNGFTKVGETKLACNCECSL